MVHLHDSLPHMLLQADVYAQLATRCAWPMAHSRIVSRIVLWSPGPTHNSEFTRVLRLHLLQGVFPHVVAVSNAPGRCVTSSWLNADGVSGALSRCATCG